MYRILTLLLGIALLASCCRRSHKNDLAENIDTYMASLSTQAGKRASSSYGVTLDYSPDSVKEDNVWIKFHFITQPGGLKQSFPPKKKGPSVTLK